MFFDDDIYRFVFGEPVTFTMNIQPPKTETAIKHEQQEKIKATNLAVQKNVKIGSFKTIDNKTISIKRVIFSERKTVVLWSDGDKTIVEIQGDEQYDKEKGLAMAIIKKLYGNNGRFNELFKEYCYE